MALNPPITSVPMQQADRNGHLQRYLTSLPTFESWQGGGEGPVQQKIETTGEIETITDREAETAERRNERRIRRRDKAAILRPKPPPPLQDQSHDRKDHDKLDQEWWDRHRAAKLGITPSNVHVGREREVEKAEEAIERKENRRLQQRIPRAKGRREKDAIPGLGIIESYKPMTTALGPRMTMKPEKRKKGMFANGKSSAPAIIQHLEASKISNPRVSLSQSTSANRLTLESPKQHNKDWKDQWRRKSSQPQPHTSGEEINSRLPPPGYTNSTSWPSTLPSSDGPSAPSRRLLKAGDNIAGRHSAEHSSCRSHSYSEAMLAAVHRHTSMNNDPRAGLVYQGVEETMYPHHTLRLHRPQNTLYHAQEPMTEDRSRDMTPQPRIDPHNQGHGSCHYDPENVVPQALHAPQIYDQQSRTQFQHLQPQDSCHSPRYYSHYPQAHSHAYPYPYPHQDGVNHYAYQNGHLPQTPIYRDPRHPSMDPRMELPRPFSLPGPSRTPQAFQVAIAPAPQFDPNPTMSDIYGGDYGGDGPDRFLLVNDEMPGDALQEGVSEGFWKPAKSPSALSNPVVGVHHTHHPHSDDHLSLSDQLYNVNQYGHPPIQAHVACSGNGDREELIRYRSQLQDDQHARYLRRDTIYSTPQVHSALHLQVNDSGHHTPLPSHSMSAHRNTQAASSYDFDGKGNEGEIAEFGASADEWKSLWSSRKPFR